MKKYYFYFLLVAGALASCTKERPVYVDREFDPSVIETTFIASDFTCTNVLAKSSVTEKGVMTWSEGDEVYYFSDAAAKKMDKIAFTSSGKTPTVMLSHKNGSKYIAAYYPGENVSDPAIKDYFFAVDAYGNSVMIFPIIGDTDNVGDPNFKNLVINGLGKIGSLEVTNAYDYDVNEKGRYELTINHTYTNRYHENDEIIRVMDGYSVQLDVSQI